MTENTKQKREYAAPALERGFDILELLAERGTALTISEIAQGLDRSISEVFRIVIVMERRGWLLKDDGTDKYAMSRWTLDVAYRGTPAQSLANVAAPVMQQLASATNQSCHLVIQADTRGLVIHREESAGPVGFAMRAGAIIDLVTSCSGHVLLAFDAETQLMSTIKALSAEKRTAVEALRPHLQEVRQRGYERQPSARTAGVTDISVPITGLNGRIMAALTVPYLVMIDGSAGTSLDETQALLIAAGRRISGIMGRALDGPTGASQASH